MEPIQRREKARNCPREDENKENETKDSTAMNRLLLFPFFLAIFALCFGRKQNGRPHLELMNDGPWLVANLLPLYRPKTKWPTPPRIDERRPLIGRKFVAPVSAENKMADPTDDWSQICCPCFVFVSDVLLVIRPLFFHWLPAYSWGQLGTVDFLLLLLLISLENYSHDILWPLRPRKASRFSAPGYWLAGWFPGQSRAADLFCSKILAFPCCCCYSLRESSQCSGCYGA